MLDPAQITFFAFLVLSASFALSKGGAPERLGAAAIVAMAVLQAISRLFEPSRLYSTDPVAAVIDGYGVLSFGVLAIYANRAWPIWATSLQILSLTSHFAQEVGPASRPGIYIVMKSAPTFFVIIALLVGTASHQTRMRRFGKDPGWKGW